MRRKGKALGALCKLTRKEHFMVPTFVLARDGVEL